jgi:hypothetical protein
VYAICTVYSIFCTPEYFPSTMSTSPFSHITSRCYPYEAAVENSEELPVGCFHSGVLQNGLVILLIECTRTGKSSWRWSIKSIKPVAFDFGHHEEIGDAKTACSKGPQ